MEELAAQTFRIDSGGLVDLPIAGQVRAGGLTIEQFKLELVKKFSRELRKPEVSVNVVEFGSQPVSVMGAVTTPGVHQLRGRKNLAEVMALAGGLRPDAGCCIKVSRAVERGPINLPSTKMSSDGKFHVANIKLKDFLEAKNPGENIAVQPHDVVTVPTAEVIYVMGAVRKPGAFVLNEKETLSVLQALSLAEGVGTTPSLKESRILRPKPGGQRVEIAVDLRKVMAGKAEDFTLHPNDILFIPTSTAKRAGLRAVEAAIYATTGVIIWRR
jgi:polysaccharide export outer membrane protein